MASRETLSKLVDLQGNLLNYAFMLTSNREKAQQLLDHTTEMVLKQSDYAADDVNFKSWAFSIMHSVFTDRYARQTAARRAAAKELRGIYSLHLTEQASVTVAPEGSFKSADVTRALESFSEGYRRPVELFFAGYSITEIANELNLSEGVVRSRVAYCRNRLKIQLSA
ncbi:MAG: sigma-70 family RNA polymerase sigma factor [Duncaniella sp.]|nr:sigma-70 family RNA polymerase sigma factor [Duncaniella sp.]